MLTWVDFGLACSEQRAVVAAVFDNLAFSTRQSALRGALRAFHSGMTSHKSFRMLVPPRGGYPSTIAGIDVSATRSREIGVLGK